MTAEPKQPQNAAPRAISARVTHHTSRNTSAEGGADLLRCLHAAKPHRHETNGCTCACKTHRKKKSTCTIWDTQGDKSHNGAHHHPTIQRTKETAEEQQERYITREADTSYKASTHVFPRSLLHRLHHLQHRVPRARACILFFVVRMFFALALTTNYYLSGRQERAPYRVGVISLTLSYFSQERSEGGRSLVRRARFIVDSHQGRPPRERLGLRSCFCACVTFCHDAPCPRGTRTKQD